MSKLSGTIPTYEIHIFHTRQDGHYNEQIFHYFWKSYYETRK